MTTRAVGALSNQFDQASARSQSLFKPRCKRPSRNACLQPLLGEQERLNTFRRSCTDGVSAVANGCLVELADDRLRRATRQEDGQVGALRSASFLLMGTGQTWQGGYNSPVGRDFIAALLIRNPKEGPMGSERTSRRELLKGSVALAGGLTLGDIATLQAQAHDHPPTPGSK